MQLFNKFTMGDMKSGKDFKYKPKVRGSKKRIDCIFIEPINDDDFNKSDEFMLEITESSSIEDDMKSYSQQHQLIGNDVLSYLLYLDENNEDNIHDELTYVVSMLMNINKDITFNFYKEGDAINLYCHNVNRKDVGIFALKIIKN